MSMSFSHVYFDINELVPLGNTVKNIIYENAKYSGQNISKEADSISQRGGSIIADGVTLP